MTTKARALKNAKTYQERLNKAERAATQAAAERDATVLEAQEAGATYAEIQQATGLSTARVTQVLRRERHARTITD